MGHVTGSRAQRQATCILVEDRVVELAVAADFDHVAVLSRLARIANSGVTGDVFPIAGRQSAADSARSAYQPGNVNAHLPAGNWITAIMPYAGYMWDVAGQVSPRDDLSRNSRENAPLFRRPMPIVLDPSLEVPNQSPDGFGLSHFAGNVNILVGKPKAVQDFDAAGTMLVAEVNAGFVPWGHPANCRDLANGLRRNWLRTPNSHPLGFGPVGDRTTVMMVMLDGSIRDVSVMTDASVLRQMVGARPRSP